MAVQITQIPATVNRFTADPIESSRHRRAAAYARVSTDHEDQRTSYEEQVRYYTEYIQSCADLEFVRVYTDEGITGTSTAKRKGFQIMIADALAGKIDLIITKSVSRFARNTVDSLSTIRLLKEHGVECWFEKENIHTFDPKCELLLTIMASVAQEEARSISENCTWGQRKRFADGKVTVPLSRFLGYDRGEDGNLVINEKEAKIVRRIYTLFLQGETPYGIAKLLTADGIPTPGGKDKWQYSVVRSILTNEKYKGDALLQKVFTVDYLTKKKKLNEGEVPQYYVEGDHTAIIPTEVFEMVQAEFDRRADKRSAPSDMFVGKIVCGVCGKAFEPRILRSTNGYCRVLWQCPCKSECETTHLVEAEIRLAFVKATNSTEFDTKLWQKLVKSVTVFDKSDVRVEFVDGNRVTVQLETDFYYGNGSTTQHERAFRVQQVEC